MNQLRIYKNIDDLLNALAEAICDSAKAAIGSRGQFNFVLSGGSSPKRLYELLASEGFRNRIDWDKVYFFFGDERFVPKNDSQRNSLMAKKALFQPLNIRDSHIFVVDTSVSPEESASSYINSINVHFSNGTVKFDFILLGLGDNAHTASLFPNTSVLEDTEATIRSVFVEEVEMYRITMTAPLINQARKIAFLVFGKDKADAVSHVLDTRNDSSLQFPAKLIKADAGEIEWFLDESAMPIK